MATVTLGRTMSLDGFVNDRHGEVNWLYPDLQKLGETNLMKEAKKEVGAVVMGKHTFEMSDDPDWYAGNYEFQVPILVITPEAPGRIPKQTDELTITYVTDGVKSAIDQAKQAAGEKKVMVMGANVGQQLLREGLADMIEIAIMPVLLGKGLRLFEHLEDMEIRLEKLRVVETGPRTDIWFEVVR